MTVAVLALQGAFIEHEHVLEELGVKTVELRQAADLDQSYDGLILPGGESTVQGKLLRELKMFDPLKKQIADGMPVLGTCAGLILLGSPEHFGTIPMQVKRNAYGRQLGSFHTKAEFKDLGLVPMSFIRAPYVESVSDGTRQRPEDPSDVFGYDRLKQGDCSIRCNLPVLLSKSDSVFSTPMSK